MLMLNSDEPIKFAHLQKLANQLIEWCTCNENVKMFFQWKQEKFGLFDKPRNILTKKIWYMGREKYALLDFAKYPRSKFFRSVKENQSC